MDEERDYYEDMVFIKRKSKFRVIVIDGNKWLWKCGFSFVRIASPNGVTKDIDIPDITGGTWDTLERGRWKRTQDGMVTPSMIEDYIRSKW